MTFLRTVYRRSFLFRFTVLLYGLSLVMLGILYLIHGVNTGWQ